MCMHITFYKNRTLLKLSKSRIEKKTLSRSSRNEEGEEYVRQKCTTDDYEKKHRKFHQIQVKLKCSKV